MARVSRKFRGRWAGARDRAKVKKFARGSPGRIRRAVLRILRAGVPRLSSRDGRRGAGPV